MSGTIGGITGFLSWQGRLQDAVRRTTLLPPLPGLDGNEVARDGWSADPSTIVTTVEVDSLQQAGTWIERARTLMSSTSGVRVDEPIGWWWDGVIVMGCQSNVLRTIPGKYRITTVWQLLPQTYPA